MQIRKILDKGKGLLSIEYAYSFLFGMLGSMFIITLFHCMSPSQQKIAVVNTTAIVKEFVKKQIEQNKSQDVLTNETKKFGVSLEQASKEVAEENHLILMPSEAIIAGSQDYTSEVKRRIKTLIRKNQVEKDDY